MRRLTEPLPVIGLFLLQPVSAGLPCATSQEAPTVSYADVASQVGLIPSHTAVDEVCTVLAGSGSAWADYDLDGDVDLFVTNCGGPNRMYENHGDLNGDGLPDFVNVAAAVGIEQGNLLSHGAVFIDYDNDGDQDLFVTHKATGNTLFQNQLVETGSLSFTDVTSIAGVADEGRAITGAWADFDNDGFLDLYVVKHALCLANPDFQNWDRLFHNEGDGTFSDWTTYLCDGGPLEDCPDINNRLGWAAGWLDYDNDGDQDLYVVNDAVHGTGGNRHWRNDGPDGEGGWIFSEISVQAGTNTRLNGMGLGVGDVDNDGWLDLAFSNILESRLLCNSTDGTFEDVTFTSGVEAATLFLVGWGTMFFDADNDGRLDLYFVNGDVFTGQNEPNVFLRNLGNRLFEDLSAESGLDNAYRGRNGSMVDFNDDGWVDVFVGNLGAPPVLYLNLGGLAEDAGHWLTVTVEGTESNRDAIGSRVWLTTKDGLLTREISSGPTHGGGDYRAAFFGMGTERSGKLRVRWPNGVVQDLGVVAANQRLHLVEPPAGVRFPGVRKR